jgi:hypothetical protein
VDDRPEDRVVRRPADDDGKSRPETYSAPDNFLANSRWHDGRYQVLVIGLLGYWIYGRWFVDSSCRWFVMIVFSPHIVTPL